MEPQRLRRELGLWGAVVTGLGSILGTGAFVAIGLAAATWGDRVFIAIPAAALLALFSGLSSAFLASRYPVAGGTYEYAYETLNPWFGFGAGWLFLLAKTASAAAAVMGVALYLDLSHYLAPLIVAVVSVLILTGVRRTAVVNLVLVSLAVTGILWFAIGSRSGAITGSFLLQDDLQGALLGSVAFLFVAFTGYGRVATLGEEVKDPSRTIPRAVVITLVLATVLYMAIALGGRAAGGEHWGIFITPATIDMPVVRVAAIAAMLGVLLNLILGMSRVWLAMGRRSDMPARLARLDANQQPRTAVVLTALLVVATALLGDLKLTWSFSAMTILIYYAITNLAAIRLDRTRVTAWLGLVSCLVLSVFVPLNVWLIGVILIGIGMAWKTLSRGGT